jgi:hypothetical protein
MATKPLRAIVCEGKDDIAAFRALLMANDATKKPAVATSRVERFETERVEITLEARDGKSMLATLALAAASGTAGVRPDMVLVSFDPDLDPPAREFAFFERDVEDSKQGRLTKDSDGRRILRINNRDVRLLPAPWRSKTTPCFAGLPEEHCIERVLIEGILASRAQGDAITGWAKDATEKLQTLVKGKGHKRAFRIWTAALDPDSESFVARLFQMSETKHACLQAVHATPAYEALRTLLDA